MLLSEEMKTIFDPCIDGVIELIKGQIQQVERKKYRVKVSELVPHAMSNLTLP